MVPNRHTPNYLLFECPVAPSQDPPPTILIQFSMQQSEVLRVKHNVKQYTANLREILSKATKDQTPKEDLVGDSEIEPGRLTAIKFSESHLKEIARNEQQIKSKSYLEDKSITASYRSKQNREAARQKKYEQRSHEEEFDEDASLKKWPFYRDIRDVREAREIREMPSDSVIKYRTKDNFFTPKVSAPEQHSHKNRSVHKQMEKRKRDVDQGQVRAARTQIKKLTRQRDDLLNQIQQYKEAIVQITEKYHQMENQVAECKKTESVIRLLRTELLAERNHNKELLWELRAEQHKLGQFKSQLTQYYQKVEQQTRQTYSYISTLEYQNSNLRKILKLGIPGQSLPEVGKFQLISEPSNTLPELTQLKLFRTSSKIDSKEYLLAKLDQLKSSASQSTVKKQDKKVFNFSVPINSRSDDRDLYEDQAVLKSSVK